MARLRSITPKQEATVLSCLKHVNMVSTVKMMNLTYSVVYGVVLRHNLFVEAKNKHRQHPYKK